jgi:two-component system, OmpR family, response regulator
LIKEKCVLVVDDHEAVRKMVCSLFQREGFEVRGAANGAEALHEARLFQPDLVVLDLAMPVMNGLDAARELMVLLPSIPVLMFTNLDASTMEREAREAGIAAVVSKSESASQLIARAKALLN